MFSFTCLITPKAIPDLRLFSLDMTYLRKVFSYSLLSGVLRISVRLQTKEIA